MMPFGGLLAAGILFLAAPAADTTPTPRTVGGSVTLAGGSLTIPAGEVREGNVTVFGGSVDVAGTISHDLTVFGGSVNVDGHVGHDVTVLGGSVHLGPNSSVGHDATVIGGSLERDPGAQVGHDLTEAASSFDRGPLPQMPGLPPLGPFNLGIGLGLSGATIVLALLLQLFFPSHVALTRDALEDRPFASLGFGCLTAIAGVLLAALLGVTVILLPLSLAIAVGMTVAWLLGLAGVTMLIGQRLTNALNVRADRVLALVIGGILVAVIVNVPFFGGLFGLVVGAMALGAVVLTRFGTRPHPPAPPPLFPPTPGQTP